MPLLRCLFALLMFVVMPAHAGVDDLLRQADVLGLANHPQWSALLHINRGGTTRDRGRSYVDDPRFFLAANGADDPQAELQATLRALFENDNAGDDTARCRYVARYRWLAMQLGQPVEDVLAACPAYREWMKPIRPGRMTLVFPGSYLNSPSSMFGHTLLRIDPPQDEASTVWLSRAISFGAVTGSTDASLAYIWKGMAGGYPGRFQVEAYFGKIQHYGRMENRDLWEYPLNLTAAETAFLVDHLWELHDTNFDYYFFDENCSYRLLELLEVARPSLQLTSTWRLSEAPVNTVRALREAGVAVEPVLRPSAERELRARVGQLSAEERGLMLALRKDATQIGSEAFQLLDADRQPAVLAAAYADIVYRSRKEEGRDPVRAEQSLTLLKAMNVREPAAAVVVDTPAPPEAGHRTRRLSVGGGADAAGGLGNAATRKEYTSLAFRITYHDLLDPVRGYLPGAELEIGDTELRINHQGDVKLERLEIANVFSLSARDRVFQGWSWRVRGGIERQPEQDMQMHSTRYVDGGGGFAWQVGSIFARAYGEVRVEHSGAHLHLLDAAIGPAVGLLGQHQHANWMIDARPLYFAGGMMRSEARAAVQWHVSPDWGLRAELRWREAARGMTDAEFTDANIVLHHYF